MNRWARALLTAAMLGVFAIPTRSAIAQTTPRYIVIDLGTLGGPNAGIGNVAASPFTSSGAVGGTADTATLSPYYPNDSIAFNGDPYVQHTFLWQRGHLADLGSLGPEKPEELILRKLALSLVGGVTVMLLFMVFPAHSQTPPPGPSPRRGHALVPSGDIRNRAIQSPSS